MAIQVETITGRDEREKSEPHRVPYGTMEFFELDGSSRIMVVSTAGDAAEELGIVTVRTASRAGITVDLYVNEDRGPERTIYSAPVTVKPGQSVVLYQITNAERRVWVKNDNSGNRPAGEIYSNPASPVLV